MLLYRRNSLCSLYFGAADLPGIGVGFTLAGCPVFIEFSLSVSREGRDKISAPWHFVVVSMTAAIAIPVGVLASVYLEEYARPTRLTEFININIANLAGVPSIVYGMLGLAIFVRFFQLERSLLSGALTMSLLILPVIIIAAKEAIRAVPGSLRQAAFAVGATRWQVIRAHVLPSALPGILTGVILAISRAIGETAPLIMIGALTYVAFVPEGPMDEFTALPIQIFNWTSPTPGRIP